MINCRLCMIELISGINWKLSMVKRKDYLCKTCNAEHRKQRYKANIELAREKARNKADSWRKRNPEKDLAAQLRRYNLSVESFKTLETKQNGVCAICKDPPGVNPWQKRLCVDHDHETNRIRGLLCDKCNRALGMLGDNVEAFKRVIKYLDGD